MELINNIAKLHVGLSVFAGVVNGRARATISTTRCPRPASRFKKRVELAAARLREKISDEEVASVNASLARSLAQLAVFKRRRRT